jgi:hypothetical protein
VFVIAGFTNDRQDYSHRFAVHIAHDAIGISSGGPEVYFRPSTGTWTSVGGSPSKAGKRCSRGELSIREAVHDDIHWIKVRYFDPKSFREQSDVERYLRRLLDLRAIYTTRQIHWAEMLGTPSIEATFGKRDLPKQCRLLIWPGRAAYQDMAGAWWFTSWHTEAQNRLLER